MSSREDILGRVRTGVKRDSVNVLAARAAVSEALTVRGHGPKPTVGTKPGAMLACFRDRSDIHATTVDVVEREGEVPAAVARYLGELGLHKSVVAWPELLYLDWASVGLIVEGRGAQASDLVGITGCFCAIAETGTFMLCSSAGTPASVSLLPETHIAILRETDIVPYMEDAWALVRSGPGRLPRSVNFVSGPSRTGDIEQTIVIGAHGPYRVHVVIISSESARESDNRTSAVSGSAAANEKPVI